MKKTNQVVLHCPSMAGMFEQVKSICPHLIKKASVRWDCFSDGTPKNMIENVELLKGSDVFFLADFGRVEEIFSQLSVIYAIPHYNARSLTVFLPYFPTATMERVDVKGTIATAKTLMRMLNAIPSCHGSGPAKVVIYDIHSLAVQHFHGDGIIIDLQSAIPLFLKKLPFFKRPIFAFPDEGARKRFSMFFPDKCIICSKDENRKVSIKEGTAIVDGAKIIIIDDMVRKGDTLENCCNTLLNYGAEEVRAFVTHGIFPENSWERFMKSGLKQFWITNSCTFHDLDGKGPFKVFSLADLIAEEIISMSL
jgi:ribose-phosphate pyrophosphokinase